MPFLFCNLPSKREDFAVVSRRLTEKEIARLVQEVFDDSIIWHEDPRCWLTYGGFLGHQISKAMMRYSIGRYCGTDEANREELDNFVEACQKYAIEQGETL